MTRRVPLIALLALLLVAFAAGCRRMPPSPPIRDVRPTVLERGETLIIELSPAARDAARFRAGEPITVTLSGTITPVGRPPHAGGLSFTGRAAAAVGLPYADRILAHMGEPQERALGGHAHFHGRVEVSAPGEPGTVRSLPLELDLYPPSLRGLAEGVGRDIEQRRVANWLGVEVAPSVEGPALRSVTAGKPAARAGLTSGTIVSRVDGRPATVDRFFTAFQQRVGGEVTLEVKRSPAAGLTTVTIPRADAPEPLWGWIVSALILFGVGLVVVLAAAVGGGFITVWERKVAGRMQSRIGPNRVGPQGWLQWLADALKLITKEDIVPAAADRRLFLTSPYLVFAGVFLTFVVLPFSQLLVVADLNIGFLYVLAVTSLVVVGVIMGGWASNSKWSLLGGMRSAAQIISYELPAGIALMAVAVLAGTLSPQRIIHQQGPWPWDWYVFHDPFVFIVFFIYFIAALAEGNRTPFDLPEAESELVSGYNTEYSGFRFGAFATAEWVNLWVIGALATALFFGGWQVPGLSPDQLETSIGLQILSFVVFFVKAATFVFVTIWLRWTLPRFRVDQMMNMCWKYFIPIAVTCLVAVTLWVWGFQGHDLAQRIASWVVFAVGGVGLLAYFLSRVVYTFRATHGRFDVNLFR